MVAALGWVATAAFSVSYFARRPAMLRAIQAAAACFWIAYGLEIRALPVVAANVIVGAAALYSITRDRTSERHPEQSVRAIPCQRVGAESLPGQLDFE